MILIIQQDRFWRFFIKLVVLISVCQSLLLLYLPGAFKYLADAPDKLFLLFSCFFIFLHAVRKGRVYVEFSLSLVVIIFFLGTFSLVLNYPGRIHLALVQFLLLMQGFIALFVFSNINLRSVSVHSILRFFLTVGVISFLFSMLEIIYTEQFRLFFHGGEIHEEAVFRGSSEATQSVFGHPGMYSWYMAFCFCISLAYFMIGREKKFLFLALIFMIGVFLSLRRKSLVACLICAVVSILLTRDKASGKLVYIAGFGALLTSLYFYFFDRINFLIAGALVNYDFSADHYVGPRVALTNASFSIANDNFPLGSGLSTFGSWMSRVDYSPIYQEYGLNTYWGLSQDDPRFINDTFWPMVLGETGYFGVLVFLLIFFAILRKLYQIFKRSSQASEKVFFLAALLVLVEIILESLASPSLSRAPQIFFVMMVVGFAVNGKRRLA